VNAFEKIYLFKIIFRFKVKSYSEWHNIEDIQGFGFFTKLFQVREYIVLVSQLFMAFNVVDELRLAVLREEVVPNSIGCGFPFEVEQSIIGRCFLPT
jgi:hypothetical protein